MTLVELLVVIVLLTTLVTTAIPIISPGGESRKIREASRSINAYFQGAKVRALQTGRPFGVALRRLSADTGNGADNAVCAQLRYVEVPPAFAGVDNSSLARVCLYQTGNVRRLGLHLVRYGSDFTSERDFLPDGYDADLVPDRFLRPGDTVEVAGRRFVLDEPLGTLGNANDNSVALLGGTRLRVPPVLSGDIYGAGTFWIQRTDNFIGYFLPIRLEGVDVSSLKLIYDAAGDEISTDTGQLAISENEPTLFATAPAPYKVYRQPVEAGGEPLELPAGVAIDLQASAFGTIRANPAQGRVYSPHSDHSTIAGEEGLTVVRQDDLMVLFAPEGNIQRVHGVVQPNGADAGPLNVTSYLALCVGRRELIPALRPDGQTTTTRDEYAEPIDLLDDTLRGLSEADLREVTDNYNWLNLESRWVVLGGPSGSVTTVENSAVLPNGADDNRGNLTPDADHMEVGEQIAAALENAPRRTALGGR